MGRGGEGVVASGKALRRRVDTAASPSSNDSPDAHTRLLSPATVAQHDRPEDAWVVVKGKVYDVSSWGSSHPGGNVLYSFAGKDATDVFSAFHSPAAWKWLQPLQVGLLSGAPAELLADFRKLRSELQASGLFNSSKAYYVMKCTSNLAICALSLTVLAYNKSFPAIIFASFLMALFWQQCGWLAHDFLHHQVFKNRSLNNAGGLFFGNLSQGFSVSWWKDKHNLHHAAPNELDHAANAVDPDIDTLPLLAWSTDMLQTMSAQQRRIVKVQHLLIFPVLLLARVSWCIQSLLFPVTFKNLSLRERALELGSLALHYAWICGSAFTLLPPLKAVVFFFLAQFFCGGMLGFVFIQSHNGMEVFSDKRDFVRSQLASTRNIHASLFNDWFTGGLNRQIEHHLFPTLPRHNLRKAQERVRALCAKHGLFYESCSMSEASSRVLLRLMEVARAA